MKKQFKIGDRVKFPKTKSTGININDSALKILFSEEKHDYLIVRWITNLFPNSSEKIVECMFPTSKMCTQFLNTDLEHYEEEFVLPQRWFVLYNTKEEFDIINNFYNKGWTYVDYKNKCGYHNNGNDQIHTKNWVGSGPATKEKLLEKGYIQITFEQFQKHILKEETMKKEIIGYKLIKPEYEEAALKITGMVNQHWTGFSDNKFLKTEVWSCGGYEDYVAKLKEAGVLNLWFEPIYKEEKQIIQMYSSNNGMFEIEVVDGKAYFRPENKHLPKQWIKEIINSFKNNTFLGGNGRPYNIQIKTSISVGCMNDTKKEDWKKVYKLLK